MQQHSFLKEREKESENKKLTSTPVCHSLQVVWGIQNSLFDSEWGVGVLRGARPKSPLVFRGGSCRPHRPPDPG